MTTLITGGCGFIGSALAKRLADAGERVVILDDESRGRLSRISRGLFYYGDVRHWDRVQRAMIDVDEVIHMASINGTRNFYEKPAEVLDVGLRGICNVMNACKDFGVKRLMIISSSEVYQTPHVIPTPETVPYSIPDPFNPRYSYAVQKIASEMVAIHNAQHFDKLIIVRPHNIYGPDAGEDHVIPRLARNLDSFYDGNQTRAFCYIDDAIDGLMLLREKGKHNNIYNLGTDEEVLIAELADRIARLTGRELKANVRKLTNDGEAMRRCPDISKMRALGFEPKVSLEEGLKLTLEWYTQKEPEHSRSGQVSTD